MTLIVIDTDYKPRAYEPRAPHPAEPTDTPRPGRTIDHIIDLRDADERRNDEHDELVHATWEDAEWQ